MDGSKKLRNRGKKAWVLLDNASKLFPAVCNQSDTKVFRITAELHDEIVPSLLQEALDQALKHFPYYRSVLKRGIFWYYLEASDVEIAVEPETTRVCAPLYLPERDRPLIRVLFYKRRLHVEFFHALTDGVGGMLFVQVLIHYYLLLHYPAFQKLRIAPPLTGSVAEKMADSYRHFFQKNTVDKNAEYAQHLPDRADVRGHAALQYGLDATAQSKVYHATKERIEDDTKVDARDNFTRRANLSEGPWKLLKLPSVWLERAKFEAKGSVEEDKEEDVKIEEDVIQGMAKETNVTIPPRISSDETYSELGLEPAEAETGCHFKMTAKRLDLIATENNDDQIQAMKSLVQVESEDIECSKDGASDTAEPEEETERTETDASDAAEPEAIERDETDASDIAEPEAIERAETDASDIAEPAETERTETDASDTAEPEETERAETDASDTAEPEETGHTETDTSDTAEPEETERTETEETASQDLESATVVADQNEGSANPEMITDANGTDEPSLYLAEQPDSQVKASPKQARIRQYSGIRRPHKFERMQKRKIKRELSGEKIAYHIRGNRTEGNQYVVIEGVLSVEALKEQIRRYDVSLTVFMTALIIYSIGMDIPKGVSRHPIVVAVPVDLRQRFPSRTTRNFFYTIKISYHWRDVPVFENLLEEIKLQFDKKLSKDYLEKILQRQMKLEKNAVIRLLPVMIKDWILRLAHRINDRKVTTAVSNLGRMEIPNPLSKKVYQFGVCTSVRRPQLCVLSYGDRMVITFTSPYIETEIQRHFFSFMTKLGVDVTIASNINRKPDHVALQLVEASIADDMVRAATDQKTKLENTNTK
ncbi:MAG: hypothetical protein GX239_01765 [Clostridiaceae bacterium]|nr:hypothetical protein [Clostridiaceae bacterium]